jgi:predicted RNase H-like HicB family nuclease
LKYLIVIEKANGNFSAYIPDVPGCGATGKTLEEVKQAIMDAAAMHFEGLIEDGIPAPEPIAQADYIAVTSF